MIRGTGVRFLKTSTGFNAKGASEQAVRILRQTAGRHPGVGVKASGGIKTHAQALAMLEAGADVIGSSSPFALLEET